MLEHAFVAASNTAANARCRTLARAQTQELTPVPHTCVGMYMHTAPTGLRLKSQMQHPVHQQN